MDLIFLKTSTAFSRIPITAIALKILVIVKTSVAFISCAGPFIKRRSPALIVIYVLRSSGFDPLILLI